MTKLSFMKLMQSEQTIFSFVKLIQMYNRIFEAEISIMPSICAELMNLYPFFNQKNNLNQRSDTASPKLTETKTKKANLEQ